MNILLPGDDGFDAERRSLNPAVDAKPFKIIISGGTADVRTAIETARREDLPFAVQATGHGTHVPADGGLLLKTGSMARVLVDPDRRVAVAGPGARWSDVLAAAAPFGLAPLSGSSPSVGVTGYTLGGGMGWLARKYGLAADSVLRAEVVLADGRTVVASPDRHADLFWALRGGGANFGVVTRLHFRLYPVSQVVAGTVTLPRDGELIARYRDWASGAPEETSTALMVRPDGLMLKVMHAGPAVEARKLLRPFTSAATASDLRQIGYAEAAMGGTPARYMDYLPALSDPAIAAILAVEASNVEIRHWGGAIARGTGPAGHRDAPFTAIVDTPGVSEGLRPFGIGGTFLNFLADPSRVDTAYTAANLARLREIKAAYDPTNFFRVNHNITPSIGNVERKAA
ncbi:MAG TPA: FAD-binding protein [Candidatus Limnocylindrales bacterium]